MRCDIIVLPLQKGFFVVPCAQKGTRPFGGRYTDRLCGQINLIWEVPKSWLMMQESRLLSFAQSVSREIMTQRKTRRMIRTDWNSISIASSAASTLFTKSLSDWEGLV